ncbi:MAG: glycerol kinase, partial [Lachnospiraceae bacterium]|nr:glycerol kinase [Lachnospiraceae bacterium]
MCRYIVAVDQSTQGTKGLLFDQDGRMLARADRQHKQIINDSGWVEHDLEEILRNTILVCKDVIEKAGIDSRAIEAMGISNQRETSAAWDKETGKPVCNAIVWQCARARQICDAHKKEAEEIRLKTGLTLSPYFPASKFAWIMRYVPEAGELADQERLALGTVDSWLIYRLSHEKNFKTDYSNASRTQLFHIGKLCWDEEICKSFGVPVQALPEVCMSDSCFGTTDLGGILPKRIPIMGVLGDSHGALFGQNCRKKGELKATYGTGSSVMMNLGDEMVIGSPGVVTSLAWGRKQKIEYVLEGNLNYTGASIRWLKDISLISSEKETSWMAQQAYPKDRTYFVPAFTGLGAPYWDAKATGLLTGITRTTGKNE